LKGKINQVLKKIKYEDFEEPASPLLAKKARSLSRRRKAGLKNLNRRVGSFIS